jgi:hypothetical protein
VVVNREKAGFCPGWDYEGISVIASPNDKGHFCGRNRSCFLTTQHKSLALHENGLLFSASMRFRNANSANN